MKALVLTLGHNSSAILIEDGNIIAGYEEERLSRVKSDSGYPHLAIMKLEKLYNLPKDIMIYVSHWFLDGKLPPSNKYWRPELLLKYTEPAKGLQDDLTHHDSHALSAQVFAGDNFADSYNLFVFDGFGTEGECISIYEKRPDKHITKIKTFHGFKNSLGLFYQYATAYCGMTMHQHEYKMLGYEAHIDLIMKNIDDLELIDDCIDNFSDSRINKLHKYIPEYDLGSLKDTQQWVDAVLYTFLDWVDAQDITLPDEQRDRILVSYFTQRHVENMIKHFQGLYPSKNLLVVGGVFYNVKINSLLCDLTPGKFCVMPLAGDQGAGLGVYQYYNGDLKWPNHLFWGHRDPIIKSDCPGVYMANSPYMYLYDNLHTHGIVNFVRGPMEFGPRTLCNTSTLAIPAQKNAMIINMMNNRTNEMPFALVVTRKQASDLFMNTDKVHKSLEYMIITREFEMGEEIGLDGGSHYYPIENRYTCRPQITDDPIMVGLLNEFGPLINTSFNFHGEPIVYSQEDIESNHTSQRATYPIITIIERSQYVTKYIS